MRDLQFIEQIGPAGGIDQSENPRPGSVRDALNLETTSGVWKNRPGLAYLVNTYMGTGTPNLIAEYVPDPRYKTSDHQAIIYGYSSDTAQYFKVRRATTVNTITPSTVPAAGRWKRYSAVQALMRYYTDDAKTEVDYTPCVVMTNGVDAPLVYHQRNSGADEIDALEAQDGGGTDISYLGSAPVAKYFALYKERLFALNCEGAGNRVYHTTSDSSLVFTVNVWPAAYNFDIGHGGEITAALSFGGQLVVFKRDSIWVVSGDGVDGQWQIDLVDGDHGCFPYCAVDGGDAIYFMNSTGVYRWSGGQAVRISHPRLQHLWGEYDWSEGQGKLFYGAYDPTSRRVLFAVGTTSANVDGALVYNVGTDTWDRWGAWPGSARSILPYGFPQWSGMISAAWNGVRPELVAMYYYLNVFRARQAYDDVGGTGFAIHWFIKTQKVNLGNNSTDQLRRFMVLAKKTGDWDMGVLPITEEETVEKAFRRGLATGGATVQRWAYLTEEKNSTDHKLHTFANFDEVADGPVDIYDMRVMYKQIDSRALQVSGSPDAVKFASAVDTTGVAGMYLVVPEDEATARKSIDMQESGTGEWDGSSWDSCVYNDSDFEKITKSVAVNGKWFSLFLTNTGLTYVAAYNYAQKTAVEIKGWGFWVRARSTVRP